MIQYVIQSYSIYHDSIYHEHDLVGGFNPSEKYESVGMILPNILQNEIHVPNHQSVIFSWQSGDLDGR